MKLFQLLNEAKPDRYWLAMEMKPKQRLKWLISYVDVYRLKLHIYFKRSDQDTDMDIERSEKEADLSLQKMEGLFKNFHNASYQLRKLAKEFGYNKVHIPENPDIPISFRK